MADASKLKGLRRGGLGSPPAADEARTDLDPEMRLPPASEAAFVSYEHAVSEPRPARIDGRSMRRSGRTVQFATRVSPEFDDRIRRVAMRDGLLLVEVLERALNAYDISSKKAAS